jgi:hypothetical protein
MIVDGNSFPADGLNSIQMFYAGVGRSIDAGRLGRLKIRANGFIRVPPVRY